MMKDTRRRSTRASRAMSRIVARRSSRQADRPHRRDLRLETLESRHVLSVALLFANRQPAPAPAGGPPPPDPVHEIHGTAWHDLNSNGFRTPEEPALAGRTIYLDANRNGHLDLGESRTTTLADDPATTTEDETGTFAFTDLAAGIYHVREAARAGWVTTAPPTAGVNPAAPDYVVALGGGGLDTLHASLDSRYSEITGLIPNRYNFTEGNTGTMIVDGGGDMFDGGNILNTNLASAIPYTAGAMMPGDGMFGPGSRYFTAKFPGLFVLAAENVAIDHFEVTGSTGTNSFGGVNGWDFVTTVNGQSYHVFNKRVWGAADPSINHIIIVPGGDGSHSYDGSTASDRHRVDGLSNVGEIYYLLFSRQAGGYASDETLINLATAFLAQVPRHGTSVSDIDFGSRALGKLDGYAWYDRNEDGVRDDTESGLAGWTVYFDSNGNSQLDATELSTTTDPAGHFLFNGSPPDTQSVRLVPKAGWAATGAGDSLRVRIGAVDLPATLANIDLDHIAIAAAVPDRYGFHEGGSGEVIVNGGQNMYDTGNRLGTDLAGSIPYTNHAVVPGDALFGPGSSYFTTKYPGLFVAGVANMSIDRFQITGRTGTGGAGRVVTAELPLKYADQDYTLFVKQIVEAATPSIIHVIIIQGDGDGIQHDFATATDDDFDSLSGLSGVPDLYYLLASRHDGGLLADGDVCRMAEALLSGVALMNLEATAVNFGQRGAGRIAGTKYHDVDRDGTKDAGEPGLSGWTIYMDANNNARLDLGEPTTVTLSDDPATPGVDETGQYSFEHLIPGPYSIREIRQPGWQQRSPTDAHFVIVGGRSLSVLLSNLDAGNASITALVPNQFNFTDGETGMFIDDGGANMYDGGNYLYSFASGNVPYSNRTVSTVGYFGNGSQYFTAKYPGLFVLAAGNNSSNGFRIAGNLGADGNGQADITQFTSLAAGQPYTAFVKRVYNASVPSVNHLIIVPGDGTNIYRSYSSYTNDDYHEVYNLFSARELYYLLVSSQSGGYLSDADVQAIANRFLSLLPSSAVDVSGIDFGNIRVGEIRGAVWRDYDRDGTRDPGDTGLTGFSVYVDANNNGQLDTGEPSTTTTPDDPATTGVDETGTYALINLPAGTHIVRQVVPTGWTQMHPGASDVHSITLTVDDATPGGNLVEGVDFGNAADGRVEGTKWNDLDGDGVRGASEPGLAGFTIYVDENNDGALQPGEPSAVTTADDPATTEVVETGQYLIREVPPGVHRVREVQQTGWQQRYPQDAHIIAIGQGNLDGLLINLDANNASITALVPGRYDFGEGDSGCSIGDGGNDMYDGGNSLATDLSGFCYSNHTVAASDASFGAGSRYFTAKYPGLWVMAASRVSINEFTISGNNGADGGGQADGAVLPLNVGGRPYTLFVKRVFNAGDPSVNHIIIVPGDGAGVTHTFDTYTDNDFHRVSGLQNTRELYYLLVARANGGHLDDPDVLAIARQFVSLIPAAGISVANIDFGNLRVGEIHGTVWRDQNRDTFRGSGEPGLPGFQVYLDANNNSQFDASEISTISLADDPNTTEMDESGTYAFLNVPLGTHSVRQSLPVAWAQTHPAASHTVTLTADVPGSSDIALGIEFGNAPDGRIEGVKFNDLDDDGVRDADEPGLAGWTVYLDQNDDGAFQPDEPNAVTAGDDPATTETIETGQYQFSDLVPGIYHVREVPQSGWQATGSNPAAPQVVSIGITGLPGVLANLDARHTAITALVPNRFDFTEGETGNAINDGGANMYDDGNYLYSSYWGTFSYSNRTVTTTPVFGSGSQYFTAKYPGLFVAAVADMTIDFFYVYGNLGADGNGQADTTSFTLLAGGNPYTVFVKRVYNASTPSVNHLIIVPGDGTGITRDFNLYTDYDYDRLGGLSSVHELYYLLVSRQAGGFLADADAQNIAQEFLTMLRGSSHVSGIDFGNRQPITAAEIRGVAWHDADRDGTRDASEPLLPGWTVYLDTDGNGQLDDGEPRTITTSDDPATAGVDETGVYAFTGLTAGTYHVSQVDQPDWIQTAPPVAASGRREYEVTLAAGQVAGNRDFGNRVPSADIEVRGAGQIIDDGDLSPATTDNTTFGAVELGGDFVQHEFTIRNVGESPLNLTGNPLVRVVGPDAADFVVTSAPSLTTLSVGAATRFTVRFTPNAAGTRSATIEIQSDDIDEGVYDFALGGSGFMPNVHAVDDLFTGAIEDTPFTTVPAGANIVIPLRAPGWDINDELLNSVGQYPTDGGGRNWAARDYDVTTSVIGASTSAWDRNLMAPFDCTPPNCTGMVNALTAPKTNVHVPPASETTFLARRNFTLDAAQALTTSGTITYTCDSGCIFYINGVYAGASPNMEFFAPFPGPTAFASNQGDEDLPHAIIIVDFASRGIQLFAGNNVFSIEIHNDSTNSSDIGFDASLSINQALSGLLLNDDVSGAIGGRSVQLESQPVDEFTGAAAGTVQLTDNNGNFTFTPLANYSGRVRFDYRLSDASTFSIGRAVIVVAPRNDPPVAIADSYTIETTRPFVVSSRGEPLVEASDHRWYYSDDGSDQDTQNPGWKLGPSAAFDPAGAGWKGPDFSQLGFSNGEENDERTLINNAGPSVGALTYYFFTRFDAPNAPGQLILELKRDDGAAVYINGVEVVTDNLPMPHPYLAPALGNAQDDGQTFFRYILDTTNLDLRESDNTLAAEVHQQGTFSSDISFDLRLFDPRNGVLGNDEDIDDFTSNLTASLVSNPIDPVTQGTLVLNPDGTFRFTPAQPQVGSASFSYRAQDAAGAVSSAVTVTLNFVNNDSGPVQAVNDIGVPQFTTSEDTPLVISAATGPVGTIGVGVLANDLHPGDETDPVTLILASPPASGGSVVFNSANNGGFTYTPGANFHGVDTFSYQVDDGGTLSNVATVQITVLGVDDPPVAHDDLYTVPAGDTLNVGFGAGLLANDTDVEGDDLELAQIVEASGPEFGILTLNADGSFTYVPDAGFLGDDTFQYTVTANGLMSAPATVTISVLAASTPSGDLDGDGRVTLADVGLFVRDYGATGAAAAGRDLNGDGRVGVRDLVLLRNLLDTPPDSTAPSAELWSVWRPTTDRAMQRLRATRRVAINSAAHQQAFADFSTERTIHSSRRAIN